MHLKNINASGSIPEGWASGLTSLQYLDLGNNPAISSTLPPEPKWSKLWAFYMRNCTVTGTLPATWSSLTSLINVDLSLNDLTGSLPEAWSTWSSLASLWLYNNRLTGTLPSSWSTWSNMLAFTSGGNQLSGTLPQSWSTWYRVGVFDVSNNQLSGELPAVYAHPELQVDPDLLPVPFWDFSGNRFSGGIPATFVNISNLFYIGLHGNPELCRGSACLDLVHQHWPSLRMLSVEGGQPINQAWCSVTTASSLLQPTKAFAMYVGATPTFDACMHSICLSQEPSLYLLGYLPEFNAALKVSSLLSQAQLGALASGYVDTLMLAVVNIIKDGGDGWIVGDGSSYDPCVDPHAPRTVLIAYIVFGVLLLLVVLDGCLLRLANVDVVAACLPGLKGRRYGWWRTPAVQGMPPVLMAVLVATFHLLSSAIIAVDVAFDIVIITNLVPLAVGYAMIGMLCASFLACGLATHLFLLAHTGKVAAGPSDSWLLRLYTRLGSQGDAAVLLASLLLVPLLAVAFDLVLVVLGLAQVLLAAARACGRKGQGSGPAGLAPLVLGCLDPLKLFAVRSILAMLLQSWPSMALTTWGYLALHKYYVGRFITAPIFLANLGTSMAHTLIAAWKIKELLIKHGSASRALKQLWNLGPDQPAPSNGGHIAADVKQLPDSSWLDSLWAPAGAAGAGPVLEILPSGPPKESIHGGEAANLQAAPPKA